MAAREPVRRTSYGANSPAVGVRGERTRTHIVTIALPLFERQGFHATSVEEIARAAGVSRATLYQYFASKEALFAELLEECGSALLGVIRRLEPLGPDAAGFAHLHGWLGEWASVYDTYASMFVEWATVDAPGSAIRSMVTRFVAAYDDRIAARLETSGVRGLNVSDAALVLTAVVHRVNYLRHRGITLGRGDAELLDNFSIIVQLLLFPATPPGVFAAVGAQPGPRPPRDPWPPPDNEPAPTGGRSARLAALGPRPAATVRKVLEAGADRLAHQGYYETSVDDIVAAAGLARGTFYKYFDEKLDLLVALSAECGAELSELGAGLGRIGGGGRGAPAAESIATRAADLRDWLRAFVALHDRYQGVFRAWIEGTPHHPEINLHRRRAAVELRRALTGFLRRVRRPYPLDLGTATVAMMAILERLPDAVREERADVSLDEVVELLATVLERALLQGEWSAPAHPPVTPIASGGRGRRAAR